VVKENDMRILKEKLKRLRLTSLKERDI